MEPPSVHRELLLPAPVLEPPEAPPLTWTSPNPFWLEIHRDPIRPGPIRVGIRVREGSRVDDDLPREFAPPARSGVRSAVSRGGHPKARRVRPSGRRPAASPLTIRDPARGGHRRLPASNPGLTYAPGPRRDPPTPLPANPDLGGGAVLSSFQPLRRTPGSRPQDRDGNASRRTRLPRRDARASPRTPTAGGTDRPRIVARAMDDTGRGALAVMASDPSQCGATLSRGFRDPRHSPAL